MSLRSIFLVTGFMAIICVLIVNAERKWFGPARDNVKFQQQFDKIIAERHWDGQINPIHYFGEVRILLHNATTDDLGSIIPVLHEIPWLREIKIYAPRLTEADFERWRAEFPNCIVIDGNSESDARTMR